MTQHLKITQPGLDGVPTVELDGKDIAGGLRGLTLRMGVNEIPQLTLDIIAHPVAYEGPVEVSHYGDVIRWRQLNDLAGHWQTGDAVKISLDQDDATRQCILTVGDRIYLGQSFEQALDRAVGDL